MTAIAVSASIVLPILIIVILSLFASFIYTWARIESLPDIKAISSANTSVTGDWVLISIEARNYGRGYAQLNRIVLGCNNGVISLEINSTGENVTVVNGTTFRVWNDLNSSKIPGGTIMHIYINITKALSSGLFSLGQLYSGDLQFNETMVNFSFKISPSRNSTNGG